MDALMEYISQDTSWSRLDRSSVAGTDVLRHVTFDAAAPSRRAPVRAAAAHPGGPRGDDDAASASESSCDTPTLTARQCAAAGRQRHRPSTAAARRRRTVTSPSLSATSDTSDVSDVDADADADSSASSNPSFPPASSAPPPPPPPPPLPPPPAPAIDESDAMDILAELRRTANALRRGDGAAPAPVESPARLCAGGGGAEQVSNAAAAAAAALWAAEKAELSARLQEAEEALAKERRDHQATVDVMSQLLPRLERQQDEADARTQDDIRTRDAVIVELKEELAVLRATAAATAAAAAPPPPPPPPPLLVPNAAETYGAPLPRRGGSRSPSPLPTRPPSFGSTPAAAAVAKVRAAVVTPSHPLLVPLPEAAAAAASASSSVLSSATAVAAGPAPVLVSAAAAAAPAAAVRRRPEPVTLAPLVMPSCDDAAADAVRRTIQQLRSMVEGAG